MGIYGIESFLIQGRNPFPSIRDTVPFKFLTALHIQAGSPVFRVFLKDFPEVMLFNVDADPHETRNVAGDNPAVVNEGIAELDHWHGTMMETSDYAEDPLWTVVREGGPFHTRGMLAQYCQRLRDTGRGHHADKLEKQYTG